MPLLRLLVLVSLVATNAAHALSEDGEADKPRGLALAGDGASPGYTLVSPFSDTVTYLLDDQARVVHSWTSGYRPGLAPYLLPNGNLLRGVQVEDLPVRFGAGGITGGIQEFSWDGELVWEFLLASDRAHLHHDIEPLPNGNLLAIVWEAKTTDEVRAAGRRETHAGDDGLWPGAIYEIEPHRPHGARVVWEWRVWDHLVQDEDPSLPNYGKPSDHPHRVDINGDVARSAEDESVQAMSSEERANLIALGYIDGDGGDGDDDGDGGGHGDDNDATRADWLHINGIDYNAELDQIVVSSWFMNEIWVIDHGTTTEQASGPAGDLLYRWGNPQVYGRGGPADRQLFHQHDPQWVPRGFPGAGNITIFNNGRGRPDEEYSSVVEIAPPLRADGTYALEGDAPFGPEAPTWEYEPPEDERVYASFISGAHRLPNGNTLVCSGPDGRVFEVTPAGALVWDLLSPFGKLDDDGEADVFTYGMFRATRIAPDNPGLQGRTLTPLDPAPLTAVDEFASRPARAPRPGDWDELLGGRKSDLEHWVDVNCAPGTFELIDNPDDDDERILRCSGAPIGLARSKEMYENFILEFEWRHLDDPGNAGLFIWADPLPALGGPFTRGVEVQICNLGNGTWFTSHGDIFPIWGAEMTPDPRFRISNSRSMPNEDSFHARPTGEWNHYRITAFDGTVSLEVNGELVTAGTNASPSKGYLCLESEGGEVHFRDMRILELPVGPNPADEASTAREAGEHTTLYTGVDLEGWTVNAGEWKADDWKLVASSMGELLTELPETWTSLVVDFKRETADEILPFVLGGQDVLLSGEQAGEWNRVEFTRDDESVTVTMGEASTTLSARTALALVNEGDALEFANIFVEAPEPEEEGDDD